MVLVAALCAGCQYAQLNVRVDLYDEDPRAIVPMSPEVATRLIEDVERLRGAARQKTALRIELANGSQEMYQQVWLDVGASLQRPPPALAGHIEAHARYVDAATQAEKDLQGHLDAAVHALQQYSRDYRQAYESALTQFQECERFRLKSRREQRKAIKEAADPLEPCSPYERSKKNVERLDDEWILRRLPIDLRRQEAEVRSLVAQAVERYRGFAGPLGEAFVIDWVGLRARINTGLEDAQGTDNEMRFRRALFSLNARLATLAGTTGLIPQKRIEDAIAKGARDSATGLFDSTLKIALELESLRADLPDDISALTALAELVRHSSRFTELIDRLQDTGDPVWRIVTSPANERHWNRNVVDTNFYAQGNSSVVVVRHDPMRYDIHEASNNPLALIKGQLAISHAVTKAAITIAGAATGLPTPTQDDKGNIVPPTQQQREAGANAAEDFAKRAAAAAETERTRERALRGLSQELASIHATLAASGGDAKVLAAQKTRLESVLQAYKALFEVASD
jgi:hypothetical protein